MLDVLRYVHVTPSPTRAELTHVLGLSRGSTSEVCARLRSLSLVEEGDVAPTGNRGRPTRVLTAHQRGPVAAAVEISHESWRVGVMALGGEVTVLDEGRHPPRRQPGRVLGRAGAALRKARLELGARVRAVGVSIPGTISAGRLLQASNLGWNDVDVVEGLGISSVPVVIGNDATLAGVSEARRGAARGVELALHLTVEVGIGGILLQDGHPLTGSTGAGGEFGHLPFGDPQLACPCGAQGCWDLEVGGQALARHLGVDPPDVPRSGADAVLARAGAGDKAAQAAVELVAQRLGRGIAGLVNALDPHTVTLSGLAVGLLDQAGPAVEASYRSGLMQFRRADPPELMPAKFPDDGSLRGAAELAFDTILSDAGIDGWQRR
jgi:predicted NBD/HSP70 family sugar kinase